MSSALPAISAGPTPAVHRAGPTAPGLDVGQVFGRRQETPASQHALIGEQLFGHVERPTVDKGCR